MLRPCRPGGEIVPPVTAAPSPSATTGDPEPVTEPRSPDEQQKWVPTDEELAANGAVIGEIVIRNEDIFNPSDPKEDHALFRLANTLHIKTRPWLIRKQLLFRPGDIYDRRVLDETERILRASGYFYDARIRPTAFNEGRVDIEVFTRDVWTLRPGISFKRQGGANTASIDFSDTNLLGMGVTVALAHTSAPERDMDSVFLGSTNLVGTRLRTELLYSDNSDGRKRSALLERPFYALDTRWAGGGSFLNDLRIDTPVGRVGVADEYQTHVKTSNVWGGRSDGLKGGWVKRFTIGFAQDESRFAPSPENPSADPVPPDRILAYPWVGFELVEDVYEKMKNRNQIERTEDFFLGTRFHGSLGYSSDLFGADREAVVFSGLFDTSLRSTASTTTLVNTSVGGRFENGSVRDTILKASGRLYVPLSKKWILYSMLSGTLGVNLDQDHELVLDGENGLRGYPREYQAGDKTFLFTLEGRYFSDLYLYRLFRIGGAIFFDMGRAWGEDFAKSENYGLLRDVGAGLRIGMTRSGLGNVLHLDVAFPLDGDPTISPVQFLVTTKKSF